MNSISRRHKRKVVFGRDGNKCFYCPVVLPLHDLTLDHRIPRSQGGANSVSNLVLACQSCNEKKADSSEFSFVVNVRHELPARYQSESPIFVKLAREAGIV
jgi:5-methylcytosine-specific restriction endonuclease McrA